MKLNFQNERTTAIITAVPLSMSFLFNSIERSGISTYKAYKRSTVFAFAGMSTLWFRAGLPFKNIWFSPEVDNADGTLIVFDAMVANGYLTWLRKQYPYARIIFWYWNCVREGDSRIEEARKSDCEIWSFSQSDCVQNGFRYNTTFFVPAAFEAFCAEYQKTQPAYDIAFFGRDKGRMDYIAQLQNSPELEGLRWYTHISPDHFYELHKNRAYKKMVGYDTMLKMQADSKTILDIVASQKNGATLRCMEAIYFERKLITTYADVVNERFYHPQNIFILGWDDVATLKAFIQSPYHPLPQEVVDHYSISQWLSRFFDSEIEKT